VAGSLAEVAPCDQQKNFEGRPDVSLRDVDNVTDLVRSAAAQQGNAFHHAFQVRLEPIDVIVQKQET
jgi:hypothetical protein